MKTSDFDYPLPPDRIAQHPAAERDAARLLVVDRAAAAGSGPGPSPELRHARFRDLPELLRPGDLLVANDTRVLPARLFARLRRPAGEREVEVLLLREEPGVAPVRIWSVLARPARALEPGGTLAFVDASWCASVTASGDRGVRHVAFRPADGGAPPFETWLARVGHVPLPPYIDRPDEPGDRDRYQTVFARDAGSVAAPTAGLHFTDGVIAAAKARGASFLTVTLHVGPGTFRPVATEDPSAHVLDPEAYRVPGETAVALRRAMEEKGAGRSSGRVIAVGTTSVRAVESWARAGMPEDGAWRETGLFVLPPFEFKVVDAMITNFHLPRSSLLFLVAAFAGRERVLRAYEAAVREGYRFYSYGDAMLIV